MCTFLCYILTKAKSLHSQQSLSEAVAPYYEFIRSWDWLTFEIIIKSVPLIIISLSSVKLSSAACADFLYLPSAPL